MFLRPRASSPLNPLRLPSHKVPLPLLSTLPIVLRCTFTRTSHRAQARNVPEQQGSNWKTNDQKKAQRSGLGLGRGFVVFALCVPLGWYLSRYLKDKRKASKAESIDGFVKYTLLERERVSSTCSIFTLQPKTSTTINLDDPTAARAITSVHFKQPQLQIARSYTLLPALDSPKNNELRFLIRRERSGEVSEYLHRLPTTSEIELRGPNADYVLPNDIQTIVFLAGGTGIAPALQLATKIPADADMHIIWASRRREDCVGGLSHTESVTDHAWNLFKFWSIVAPNPAKLTTREAEGSVGAIVAHLEHIEGLKQQADAIQLDKGDLKVDYYVDEEGTVIRPVDIQRAITLASRSARGGEAARKLLFVSGPEGFLSYWAGPKQWAQGHETQGPLGGALSALDLRGWEVIKL